MLKRVVIFSLVIIFISTLTYAGTVGKGIDDTSRAEATRQNKEIKGTINTVPRDIKRLAPAIDTTTVSGCTETTKFSGGDVKADRTLTKACSPYTITNDINVYGNAMLTIERGVTILFNPDTKLSIGQNSAAKLVADGTAADPIVLTSSNSTPGAGDWVGVQLWENTMSGIKLSYLKLDYCGSNGDACLTGMGGVKANRVALDHVIFAHVGAGSNAITQTSEDSNFTISNCTFNDISDTPTQQYAISLFTQSFPGIDSTNNFNGSMVEIRGGAVSVNTMWKNIGTVVAVTDNINIEGAPTPTLTVAAGSTLKFVTDTGISVGYNKPGKLVLAGTATGRVTLMSLVDVPGPGDWAGIALWENSKADIAYSTISHAGSGNNSVNGAVSVISNTSILSLKNSTISYSSTYGIGVPCDSTAAITNTGNTFISNASGDVGPGPDSSNSDCE